MTYLTKLASPMGPLSLASDGESILGLWLELSLIHISEPTRPY